MAVLTVPELFALVQRHGATPEVARIAVAAALVESGGDPLAIGDDGHSAGLWQLHDQGLGAGMSLEARQDPDQAAARILPVFARWYAYGVAQGLAGETLARYTYLYTERPAGFPHLDAPAAERFARQWRALEGAAPPAAGAPTPEEWAWYRAVVHDILPAVARELEGAVEALRRRPFRAQDRLAVAEALARALIALEAHRVHDEAAGEETEDA